MSSPLAIGIDLIEIERVRTLLQQHGERFKARTFTAAEIAYCESHRDPAPSFAARFAAKEAVAKALGSGIAEGIAFTHIEVVRSAAGQPSIVLHEAALAKARTLGIERLLVSLTHTRSTAAASVVAIGP
jgi:holo-[acyl-carrier protein] synthase